ncbi:hypothetical protein X943_000336 [Babesia divergens]|uniref:Uncharacterized protein n=1 Tax=Babesia divergens TaxID=32595 RepID=A0AAD9G902_BABDI|nr:hypothetical protein X943_000336 [Babesia divergens]
MKVSRTLITVALCLVSLGHGGRGVLGDNSVGRRLSGQEDVSAGMLGVSDPDGPVPSGFFGSVKYAIKEFYSDSKVFCIGIIWLIISLIVSGIAVACVKPDKSDVKYSSNWINGGCLISSGISVAGTFILYILYYSKPSRPLP